MTPVAARDRTAFRLVTGLFLRRLLDNDLVSPHTDRRESLALMYASVLSLALIVTFLLSTTYLAAFIQLPGPASLSALSDRFLFIGASIAMGALAALMVWDALALEPRDTAILGPLPIAAHTIARAKLAAAVIFGAVLTIALNAVPIVIYPVFLTLNIRGTPGGTLLRLMAGQATAVTMGGLFGFFGVIAIRGMFRLLLGEHAFWRVSSAVQSGLVVTMITALLLAPTVSATNVRHWVEDAHLSRWPARPVLWYLGVNETLAGHLVVDLPVVLPPRFAFLSFPKQEDLTARAAYRKLRPQFAALASRGWTSFVLMAALALVTFLWSNRRLPDRSAGVPSTSRMRAMTHRLAERHTRKDPEAQAGFFFALHTLSRSAPHRTVMAVAAAVGLTHALIVLAQRDRILMDVQSIPLGVFGISIMWLMALVAGVAYAMTVPAAPSGNWNIRMAWLGDERGYLAGVKRAALLLVAGLLLVLLPLHVALLGIFFAVGHSVFSLLVAIAACDILFLTYRNLPFACSYVPIENPKLVWPIGAASLIVATYGLAWVERLTLHTATSAVAIDATLAAIALMVRSIDRARRRRRLPINFDARPRLATQRLGLSEHITIHD
ncbi:MAG TPA: hypothetical protein VHU82_13350 [Vicinamibacterales bacterium]|jgi:hypothetical protein|nr:hypothetical protein [Vicinamibacterales bacterium]